MTWLVERWGGSIHHKSRIEFIGSEDLARAKFKKIGDKLKRGEVRLIDESRAVVSRIAAKHRGFTA